MKWFNPYRWIGAAVISLNFIGQGAKYATPIEAANNVCWATTGTGLGTIHPGLEVGLKFVIASPQIAENVEKITNQYWLESAYSVNNQSCRPIQHIIDKDTVLLETINLPKVDLNLVD